MEVAADTWSVSLRIVRWESMLSLPHLQGLDPQTGQAGGGFPDMLAFGCVLILGKSNVVCTKTEDSANSPSVA